MIRISLVKMCSRCRRGYAAPERRLCQHCLDLVRKHAASRRNDGKCNACGDESEPGRARCEPCRVKYLKYQRRWRGLSADSPVLKARDRISRLHGQASEIWKRFRDRDGRCGICRTTDPGSSDRCLDVDPASGRAGRLLCRKCIMGLHGFGRSPETLAEAIRYLEQFRQGQVAESRAAKVDVT